MGRKLQRGFLEHDRSLEDELRASRFCGVVSMVVGGAATAGTIAGTAAIVGAGASLYSASESSRAQSRAAAAAERSAAAQGDVASRQLALAEDQYSRYLDLYGPIEEAYIEESMNYGSIGNQELAATKAGADVAAVQGGAKTRFERNLTSLGVNPNDQKFVNTMADMELQGAGQRAGAQTGARERVRDVGVAMRKDVASLGRGIPSSTASMLSSASSTMQSGANAQIQALTNQANSWNQAAMGLGGLTGKIINSNTFKNWWDQGTSGGGLNWGDSSTVIDT